MWFTEPKYLCESVDVGTCALAQSAATSWSEPEGNAHCVERQSLRLYEPILSHNLCEIGEQESGIFIDV